MLLNRISERPLLFKLFCLFIIVIIYIRFRDNVELYLYLFFVFFFLEDPNTISHTVIFTWLNCQGKYIMSTHDDSSLQLMLWSDFPLASDVHRIQSCIWRATLPFYCRCFFYISGEQNLLLMCILEAKSISILLKSIFCELGLIFDETSCWTSNNKARD